jgi:AraC family transcriptional regulator of adaptative response/methylated-DNA-[protein]-cysteine methyltransferase
MRKIPQKNQQVTQTIYDAGFTSSSPFYQVAVSSLAMKPPEYKKGTSGINITYAVSQSYLGWVLVAATDIGLCAIDFGDLPYALEERLFPQFPKARFIKDDSHFSRVISEVLSYLESPQKGFDLPLDIMGTAFQRQVWIALRQIPSGATISYSDLAKNIGKPRAVRAVANACASNKIAAVIPCHRIVRSGGDLGGYRWGIERKRQLLEREKVV